MNLLFYRQNIFYYLDCLFSFKVPSLNEVPLHYLKPNSFVKFRCMIQDMFDPEFYMGVYETVNRNTKARVCISFFHGACLFIISGINFVLVSFMVVLIHVCWHCYPSFGSQVLHFGKYRDVAECGVCILKICKTFLIRIFSKRIYYFPLVDLKFNYFVYE